jgi:hypothetical protein
MECSFASRFLSVLFRTRRKRVTLHVVHTLKRICRLRFSFFANDQPTPWPHRLGRPVSPDAPLGVVQGL